MINKDFKIYHHNNEIDLGVWIKKQSGVLLHCSCRGNYYMWYHGVWNYSSTYKIMEKYLYD